MLRVDKFIFFIPTILFSSCNLLDDRDVSMDAKVSLKSFEILEKKQQLEIYNKVTDSLRIWTLNKLGNLQFEGNGKEFILDSILCINKDQNRLIGCLININHSNPNSDGLDYFYGEKINGFWFFFRGAYKVIPREMVKNHNVKVPLSYQQLHEIALKEVYSPYLQSNGEINEEWFTSSFEGPGWGDINEQEYFDWCFKGKRFNNKKEFYEQVHLCKVKKNWLERDTTKPIIPLPKKETLP